MKNHIVILCENNIIKEILGGQFRTSERAKWFVEDNYPEFSKDICQYSKFESPEFIKIIKP